MRQIKNRHAFTLVELIVVITILAIVGTMGFLSFQGYAVTARDSTRISDLTTISKTLELFKTQEGFYPNPTDFYSVSYSGSLAWRQGTFGEDVRQQTKRISTMPLDPLTQNQYAYSVTNTRQEYELGGISENPISYSDVLTPLVPTNTANADNNFFAYIKGNYNKQIVTVEDNIQIDRLYILGVPTIITTEITDVTVQDILANQSFAVKNSQNLPASYANKLPNLQTHTGSISFTPGVVTLTAPLIYEGLIGDLSNSGERQKFGEDLISYYGTSNLSGDSAYQSIANTPLGQELAYINTIIQADTGGIPGDDIVINIVASGPTNICTDMSVAQLDELNNWISIDPSTGYAVAGTSSLTISEWCNLDTIYTTGKQYLTYVPQAIGMLFDLKSLDLRNNSLTDLPSELGNLDKLTWLNLFKNQFTEVPAVVYTMSSVETLAINHNQILTVSPDIQNMTGLVSLYLTSMGSRSLTPELVEFPPEEIKFLPNLINLYIARNGQDIIPDYISELTNLQAFHIYGNDIVSLSPQVCTYISSQGWVSPSVGTNYTLGYRDEGQSTGVTNLCP